LEVLRKGADLATAELIRRAQAQEPSAAFWRVIIEGLAAGSWHEVIGTVCKRRGWTEKNVRPEALVVRRSAAMDASQLRALVMELIVTRGAFTTWGTLGFGKTLTSACAAYKIDLRKIENEAKAGIVSRR
jgi:hypothetical protein